MTVDAKAVVNCNRLKISDILRWWASHLLVVLSRVLKRFLKGFLRLFLSPRVFLRVHWPRLFYALSSCYMGWQQLLHIMIGRSERGSPSFAMLSFPCCPPNSEELCELGLDCSALAKEKSRSSLLPRPSGHVKDAKLVVSFHKARGWMNLQVTPKTGLVIWKINNSSRTCFSIFQKDQKNFLEVGTSHSSDIWFDKIL